MRNDFFNFKQFSVANSKSAMPISTDSVLIGAWCDVSRAKRILDVGTGTGVIALMLAQRKSDAIIDAIDVDRQSVEEASENVDCCPWPSRIHVVECDYNDWWGKHDLIVSNPPFFVNGIKSPMETRAKARHTQSLTYEQLIRHSRHLLNSDGSLSFISPFGVKSEIIEIATFNSMNISRMCEIVSVEGKRPKRIMWELTLTRLPLRHEKLSLRTSTGDITEAYRLLCSDFYSSF